MVLTTSIDIAAPPEVVWETLADFSTYADWNPLTPRVDGSLDVGETVTLTVRLGGNKMKRKHTLSRADGTALCWTIQSGAPWLIRGERCQTLTDLGDGTTRYENEERVEGLVGPLVKLTYGRTIQSALEAVGEGLKAHVEALAG